MVSRKTESGFWGLGSQPVKTRPGSSLEGERSGVNAHPQDHEADRGSLTKHRAQSRAPRRPQNKLSPCSGPACSAVGNVGAARSPGQKQQPMPRARSISAVRQEAKPSWAVRGTSGAEGRVCEHILSETQATAQTDWPRPASIRTQPKHRPLPQQHLLGAGSCSGGPGSNANPVTDLPPYTG